MISRLSADVPATAAWRVEGKPTVVEDEILKRPVFEFEAKKYGTVLTTAPVEGEYSVEALVRFSDPDPKAATGYAILRCGVSERSGKRVPAYTLNVARRGERSYAVSPMVGEATLWTQPLREGVLPENNIPSRWWLTMAERFPLERISPVWEEDFRVSVENDMLSLPREATRWRRMRIEVRQDRVRMYHDGLLAFDEPRNTRADGAVVLELMGPARLAELKVEKLTPVDSRFEPVMLDDLCNAAGFIVPDSLPAAGREVSVAGIPLIFPSRTATADHVDVGRSVYRYRLSSEFVAGDPLYVWPPMTQLDPVRLRVRVPKGAYRRMWIVAAADGQANKVPLLTVRFFKPLKGWPIDAVTQVPEFTASTAPDGARALQVRRPDGSTAHLWLLSVDLDAAALASELRNEQVFHVELTKEVKPFRAFPDPMNYGYFQAGLPSSVHLYAATLERAPLELIARGNRNGNTYPNPEQPVWDVQLTNPHAKSQTAQVTIDVTSPLGNKQQIQETAVVGSGLSNMINVQPKLSDYGLYTVRTTVTSDGHTQSREGTFVTLPPDTRRTTAKNTRWGLWVWGGGHDTNPNPVENLQLLRAYGSLVGGNLKQEERAKWGVGPTAWLGFYATPEWAMKDPYDPAEYAKYSEECGQKLVEYLKKNPDLQYVSIFAEHMISLRVTHGNPPEAHNKPWHEYTPEEKTSIRAHLIAAQAAYEGCRKHAPQIKFLFGHCGPLFSLPFMKQGYPKEWFDGYGVDCPQFERMPERPPRAVECNHMFFLNQEMKRLGYKKEIVHVESYYPSSHPLALGARGSADSMVRTAVLSMANGTDRFLACWTLDDCEGYWGSQHYGCIGLIGRKPEFNPKAAAPAFGTMSQMLDTATFDGYVPTGSRSAYCVRFKEGAKFIYALWTIRGSRPVTLNVKPGGTLLVTDEHGNERPLAQAEGQASVTLSPTPVWVTAVRTAIDKAEVGAPTYVEKPGQHQQLLENFEQRDWKFSDQPNERYATNSWDMPRGLANYSAVRATSAERKSQVLQVALQEKSENADVTGRYRVLTPPTPIAVPGKAKALGVWANGNSGWGRFVYEIVDAKGEVWQSIGMKDQWNCDDTHSWSNFNFDGWRYLEFPLPNNSPGDDYREHDSVWWNHSADGIVDLPVQLTKVIIEMPTHQIYVNEMLPVERPTVELDDFVAVYESAEDMTDAPVRRQRAAAGMLRPKASGFGLPNPILAQQEKGGGKATRIVKLAPPTERNDGTQAHVTIEAVSGAKEYQAWVAAYPDGRGAVAMAKGVMPELVVNRLRPGMPLYVFASYTDADGKPSLPSAGQTITLKDEFLQK